MNRVALIILAFAALLVGISYSVQSDKQLFDDLKALAVGEMAMVELFEEPQRAPQTAFEDRDGKAVSFGDFEGRVVLVNFWATWCAPCVAEMPSLELLQEKLGGAAFTVIAVSLDRQGYEVIDPFFSEIGLELLPSYLDHSNRLSLEVGAIGLPTSILIDRDGRMIARMVGPAEWSSTDAARFIQRAIEED
jgi:thiol-disulfide isomerase/thioredoxin